MIESYSFGCMERNGKQYTADLIIYPDGNIQDSWWRKEGHLLQHADILAILDAKPEIIVVGSGAAGIMRLAAGLKELLEKQGVELLAQKTAKAYVSFNQYWQQGKKVAGCFHLTC